MNTWMLTMKYVDSTNNFRLFWFVHNGIHPQACNQINQANRCVILWNWACFILRQTHILTSIMWYAESICSMYWITTSYIFQLANKWPNHTQNMSEHTTVHKNHKTHGKEYTTPRWLTRNEWEKISHLPSRTPPWDHDSREDITFF